MTDTGPPIDVYESKIVLLGDTGISSVTLMTTSDLIEIVGCYGGWFTRKGVGKTSLVVRYVEQRFATQQMPTIGASFLSRTMWDRYDFFRLSSLIILQNNLILCSCQFPSDLVIIFDLRWFTLGQENVDMNSEFSYFVDTFSWVDEIRIKLQLWDTAGQERFRSLVRNSKFHQNSFAFSINLYRPHHCEFSKKIPRNLYEIFRHRCTTVALRSLWSFLTCVMKRLLKCANRGWMVSPLYNVVDTSFQSFLYI